MTPATQTESATRVQPAVLGGEATRKHAWPAHPLIGDAEKEAVMQVLDSGKLSGFLASPGDAFLGGPKVLEFERRFAEHHRTEYAVAFNSATSALHAAVVAVGVEPGDEVIASPYTFTASAACIVMHQAVPVFADVEDVTYGLDAASIESRITAKTRAIIPVHLFGHPADMDAIMAVAHKHNLRVIEDAAQAPGAWYGGKPTGTIGDCGVFSFTENKNLATGEGGMLITNDRAIAEAARLVRNHGEVVWGADKPDLYGKSILGWNYRMTEMEAALGIVQFGRMNELNGGRADLATYLTEQLHGLDALTLPDVQPGCVHAWYAYAFRYDAERAGLPRDAFVAALNAEGIPFNGGYVPPLYWGPMYHDRLPAPLRLHAEEGGYDRGRCPVVERLHTQELALTGVVRPPASKRDMDDIAGAIRKVLAHADELAEWWERKSKVC